METVRIRDPGRKKVGSGIRDKHPGSATLPGGIFFECCDKNRRPGVLLYQTARIECFKQLVSTKLK
jgi:hypothetical protein